MHVRRFSFPQAALPALADDDIHVWLAPLVADEMLSPALENLLDEEENRRAQTILVGPARSQFRAGRAILRTLLGHYTATAPAEIRLEYAARGKPRLAPTASSTPLEFNLSHTDGMLALAFCRRGPVGIDVERIRPVEGIDAIVEQTFAEDEKARFFGKAGGERLATFFQLWTRRESLLKALGDGIGAPGSHRAAANSPGPATTLDWRLNSAHHLALTARYER